MYNTYLWSKLGMDYYCFHHIIHVIPLSSLAVFLKSRGCELLHPLKSPKVVWFIDYADQVFPFGAQSFCQSCPPVDEYPQGAVGSWNPKPKPKNQAALIFQPSSAGGYSTYLDTLINCTTTSLRCQKVAELLRLVNHSMLWRCSADMIGISCSTYLDL